MLPMLDFAAQTLLNDVRVVLFYGLEPVGQVLKTFPFRVVHGMLLLLWYGV